MREPVDNETVVKEDLSGLGSCPMEHSSPHRVERAPHAGSWTSWLRPFSSQKDNQIQSQGQNNTKSLYGGEMSSCPVKATKDQQLPQSIEEAAKHSHSPHTGQKIPLSTVRTVSSIPRTNSPPNEVPHHQPKLSEQNERNLVQNWIYPSEQQFFNAMQRKGWNLPPDTELTVPHVVRIHNAVNEKGWRDVLEWEKIRGNEQPRLVRFIGRPNDLSPRARFNSMILMKKAPFDRHDWFVDGGDSSDERRYVIDFYSGETSEGPKGLFSNLWSTELDKEGRGEEKFGDRKKNLNSPPSMYIDARPALDNVDVVCDHAFMLMKNTFPGIYEALRSHSSEIQSNPSSLKGTESVPTFVGKEKGR